MGPFSMIRLRDFIIRGSLLAVLLAPIAVAESSDSELLSPDSRIEMESEITRLQSRIQRARLHWRAGMTSMMRLDESARLARRMPGPLALPASGRKASFQQREFSGMNLPPRLDWRDQGGNFVTPLRDQGDCSAGWAYASTAALESAFLLGMNAGALEDFDLSENQLIECMGEYGFAASCENGWASDALWFAENVGMLESCCLPSGVQVDNACAGGLCGEDESRRYRLAESGVVCYRADVAAIRRALLIFGPLISSMETYPSMDAYSTGIYSPLPGEVADGVQSLLIVGYDSLGRAWLVKNSWGDDWGEDGFAWISWDAHTGLGNDCHWLRFDPLERGPHASFSVSTKNPLTGEACRFEDRSVSSTGEIVSWEWDFDGDGSMDAQGPGPHEFLFENSGRLSPLLRVIDSQGREDIENPLGLLEVSYHGPRWVVDADSGSPYGEGSPAQPFMRVQSALNAAAAGDTVLIMPGLYQGVLNVDLQLKGVPIVLRGMGEPGEVVLDGDDESRILTILPGDGAGPTLENLIFRAGLHSEGGAAVLAQGATARFADCRFESNRAQGVSAGGGAVWSDRALLFERCVFTDNLAAGPGGAIRAQGVLGLSACRFEANASADGGGALAIGPNSLLDAVNSVFFANESARGGAILGHDSRARLVHLSAASNGAEDSGGFLHWTGGRVELANSILWNDEAPMDAEIHASEAEVDLGRCLIASADGSSDLLVGEPSFVDLDAGDLHLVKGSAGLAAGEDLGVPVDLDGRARPNPMVSAPDLGAYETEGQSSAADEPAPMAFTFEGIYPNPFNPSTTILFRLEEAAEVKADIYHPNGQWVSTLMAEEMGAGSHRLSWTARSEIGEPLASGLFLVRIECRYADGRVESDYRKAILVK
jgi:hypothetical protein